MGVADDLPLRGKMACRAAGAMLIAVWSTAAIAQSGTPGAVPGSSPSAASSSATINMQQPAPGDHWTYEDKDEISGAIKETRTVMVTDVTANEIAARFDIPATGRSGVIFYDHAWNIRRNAINKYTPNDGSGVKLPLTPNAQWKFTGSSLNSNTGATWNATGTSHVIGQEVVKTKAGTFDTFVVETKMTTRNAADPTRSVEVTTRTWFNNDVNHWVRRNTVLRESGHVVRNQTDELTSYGRKQL